VEERFEFNIPDENLSKFKEMMKKVSRKSVKLGFAPVPYITLGYHIDKEKGKLWDMYVTTHHLSKLVDGILPP
jgi:hypothetical protein